MASTTSQIRTAAAQTAPLLASLHTLSYAPPQLKQQTTHITTLRAALAAQEKSLPPLRTVTSEKLHAHEKHRDSHFRKHAFGDKAKAKFAAEAEAAEQAYMAAVMAQKGAEDEAEALRRELGKAEDSARQLQGPAKQYAEAQAQLDALYDDVFLYSYRGGADGGYPEEAVKRSELEAAERRVEQAQRAHKTELKVIELLGAARYAMRDANSDMGTADAASTWDMWGGGALVSMAKMDALDNARSDIGRAQWLIAEANRLQGEVHQLEPVDIVKPGVWSDVVFDNVFTDVSVHHEIQNSEQRLNQARSKLEEQRRRARDREVALGKELGVAGEQLEVAKDELRRVRMGIFEAVAGTS